MTRKGLGSFPRPLPFVRGVSTVLILAAVVIAPAIARSRRIAWDDLAPLHGYLQKRGLAPATFSQFIERTHAENERRVREGDLDHLVFYLLQSADIEKLAPIEPALSAKALVDGMNETMRQAFLRGEPVPASVIPKPADERLSAGLRTIDGANTSARAAYFRELVHSVFPLREDRAAGVGREYLRAMRFVYLKEFVAQRAERPADAVAELYRSRGLSTDTAIEAGFIVREGLGIGTALAPERRIRRVLIVGPGLDLAPRTALNQLSGPESYQPWAVMDALLSLGVSVAGELEVIGADINPRVVDLLRRYRGKPLTLSLATEIRDGDGVTLRADYREYFARLGGAIGRAGDVERRDGRLIKSVQVAAASTRALSGERLDIVTERLQDQPFDLIVATNILPYFDDTQLALALANIAAMLAPGGVFLHNEPRPLIGELTQALSVPFEQSRYVTIATVRSGPPLFDSVFLHKKK